MYAGWVVMGLEKSPPQELHTYLKVWYYVIVGEGEKRPQGILTLRLTDSHL